jgi:hypothetical protein
MYTAAVFYQGVWWWKVVLSSLYGTFGLLVQKEGGSEVFCME